MRVANESDRRDVPRGSLWLVAVVCFGPLTVVWLLGVLLSPLWVSMLALQLAEPERFADASQDLLWSTVAPIAYVIAGGIGLVGLVRVLTLPRERPKSHRFFTIGMVAVGLTALLIFDLPMLSGTISEFSESIAGVLIYFVLPFTGGAYLLAKSWRLLLAGRVRSDADARGVEDRTPHPR